MNRCIKRRIKDINRIKNHVQAKKYKAINSNLPYKCNPKYCNFSFETKNELLEHQIRCSLIRDRCKTCEYCQRVCYYDLFYKLHECSGGYEICHHNWCNYPVRTTDGVYVEHLRECMNYARCETCMFWFLFKKTALIHNCAEKSTRYFNLVEIGDDPKNPVLSFKITEDELKDSMCKEDLFVDFLLGLEFSWLQKCKEINLRNEGFTKKRKYYKRYVLNIVLLSF